MVHIQSISHPAAVVWGCSDRCKYGNVVSAGGNLLLTACQDDWIFLLSQRILTLLILSHTLVSLCYVTLPVQRYNTNWCLIRCIYKLYCSNSFTIWGSIYQLHEVKQTFYLIIVIMTSFFIIPSVLSILFLFAFYLLLKSTLSVLFPFIIFSNVHCSDMFTVCICTVNSLWTAQPSKTHELHKCAKGSVQIKLECFVCLQTFLLLHSIFHNGIEEFRKGWATSWYKDRSFVKFVKESYALIVQVSLLVLDQLFSVWQPLAWPSTHLNQHISLQTHARDITGQSERYPAIGYIIEFFIFSLLALQFGRYNARRTWKPHLHDRHLLPPSVKTPRSKGTQRSSSMTGLHEPCTAL